jgi:GTP pyrophosphokinase
VTLKKRFVEEVRKSLHLGATHTSDLRKSFNVAFWAYRNVKRRSGEAYVFHPMRGALVMAWIMSEYKIFDVSLLHDALLHDSYEETEDTWYSQLLIRTAIHLGPGSDVATDVLYLTKDEDESTESYYFRLLTCGQWRVLMVKFVDRIDNLWTISVDPSEKRARKIRETEIWFPRLGIELTRLVEREFEAGRLEDAWLEAVSFIKGYLWYAVGEKRKEFGIT